MSVNDYDVELYEAVQDLVEEGLLEETDNAYGVAQQVIHQGYDSLSPKQRGLYNALVIPALKKRGVELSAIHQQNAAD
jgi:hypothetical protein